MATEGVRWRESATNKFQLEWILSLTGSPLVWHVVEDCIGFSRNPVATDQIPFTNYSSDRKERKAGLPDDGTWDVTCNFRPHDADQEDLIGYYADGTVIYWRASYPRFNEAAPQRATETFNGSIQTLAINTPGPEETAPHTLTFTILGGGEYTYVRET